MGSKIVKISILVGTGFGLLFLLSLFLYLFETTMKPNHRQSTQKLKRHNDFESLEFRIMKYNPHTDESSISFVSRTKEDLEGIPFIREEDSEGNIILKSHHTSEPYIFHGSCYCSDEKVEEVKSLVAAKSRQEAKFVSGKDIKSICEKKLSECESDVSSRIDMMSRPPKKSDSMFATFWCTGVCESNINQEVPELKKRAEEFPCWQFHRGNRVKLYIVDSTMEELLEEARNAFVKETMYRHCRKVGKINYERYETNERGKKKFVYTKEFMCTDGYDLEERNPTIKCYME